jgi:hypothetical protein
MLIEAANFQAFSSSFSVRYMTDLSPINTCVLIPSPVRSDNTQTFQLGLKQTT